LLVYTNPWGVGLMELVRAKEASSLTCGPVTSRQLIFSGNSRSERVTLTRVTVLPGGENARHTHDRAEQVWHVLAGTATLLLSQGLTQRIGVGDTVRFADGEEHGAVNDGTESFEYISVTCPSVDFRSNYETGWGNNEGAMNGGRP
jgi:quercetin dioxygenase-like cupin family protein